MPKPKYIIGNTYGDLTILDLAYKDSNSTSIWKCRCLCGNIIEKRLSSTSKLSCGNCPIKIEKFGKLTTTGYRKMKRNRTHVECLCECGNKTLVECGNLKCGISRSCGCLISEATTKRNKLNVGELNPNYIKDRSKLSIKRKYNWSHIKFRESVLDRDDYKCVICTCESDLHVHHLRSYNRFPELRYDVNNGTSLCKVCHLEFHNLYGRLNFTSDDFYEFLKMKGVSDE